MAQVLREFSFQGSLDQQLGQLLEQVVLADQVFLFFSQSIRWWMVHHSGTFYSHSSVLESTRA